MAQTITIGCRLPSGIVLELPGKAPVHLAGQRQAQERSKIILLSQDDYGVTDVDLDFWNEWKRLHSGNGENMFAPLKNGAIFEAKNTSEAKAIQKELADEPTGHEPMPQVQGNIESAA